MAGVAHNYPRHFKRIGAYLKKGDFFVNIGANDGISNDPIYPFIEPFALQGIAVEPVAITYQTLCRNYAMFPQVICEHAAIYANEKMPLYRFSDELLAACPRLTQGSGAEIDKMIEKIKEVTNPQYISRNIHEIAVADALRERDPHQLLIMDDSIHYLTYRELLDKHHVNHVDFLNIDAEGIDLDIFLSLDLDRDKPKVIVIETVMMEPGELALLQEKMQHHGYTWLQKFDYYSDVYVLESLRQADEVTP